MEKIEIKDLSLLGDYIENIKTPSVGEAFMFVFEIEIGTVDKEGADCFRFTVCNKEWMVNCLLKDREFEFLNDYNILLIDKFSIEIVCKAVNSKIDEINTSFLTFKWPQKGLILNSYFRWEYFREFVAKK